MNVLGRCWTIFEPDKTASPATPAMFLPGEHGDMPGYTRVVVVPATTTGATEDRDHFEAALNKIAGWPSGTGQVARTALATRPSGGPSEAEFLAGQSPGFREGWELARPDQAETFASPSSQAPIPTEPNNEETR